MQKFSAKLYNAKRDVMLIMLLDLYLHLQSEKGFKIKLNAFYT